METINISSITNVIMDNIVKELKKKKNRDKIVKNVIDPILCDIKDKYYPYFITLVIILILIILLLVSILSVCVIDKSTRHLDKL